MSLGENLQYLRKRENITQEQLAEQLEVSRQSVSKWESDTTYPEMDKLLQLCQMFHCSMDDLVQGKIKEIDTKGKTEYDSHMNQFSKSISAGVGMILLGLSVALLLYGCNYFLGGDTEIIKEDFGGIIFFIFLTISVAIFIVSGIQHSDYVAKNPSIENFYLQEEIDTFHKRFSVMVAAGVSVILIGIMIMMGMETIYPEIDTNEYLESLLTSFFMFTIAIGTTTLTYAGMQDDKYNIDEYNKMNDKNSNEYKKRQLKRTVCACIMLLSTILYLIVVYTTDSSWGMPNAAIFAVGGICCAIASIIINYKKSKSFRDS
ncbi:MAG: helix-turn-helix domain-containing protein [Eubacterium sp.]|nr:helix-turn-helix domain-containing protein [Eubacterium sp.]